MAGEALLHNTLHRCGKHVQLVLNLLLLSILHSSPGRLAAAID